MILDVSLIVAAAVAVFLQAMLGLFVATRSPSEQRRKYYEIAFGVIGAFGLIAIVWGGVRTIQYQTKIDAGMSHIAEGQDALPNKVLGLLARLMGVPSQVGGYPDSVLGQISSKIEDLQRRQIAAPIIIPGGTTYHVPTISALVDVQRNKAMKTTLFLPSRPYVGERLDIKFSGEPSLASSAAQLLVRGNGHSIDGRPEYVLPFPNEAITVTFDGKRWVVT